MASPTSLYSDQSMGLCISVKRMGFFLKKGTVQAAEYYLVMLLDKTEEPTAIWVVWFIQGPTRFDYLAHTFPQNYVLSLLSSLPSR